MLCDFSFKTATFSKPADPGRNDLDEQKTDNDRENNDEIEIVVRHCPCVSVRRQSNAGAAMTGREKQRRLRAGLLKSVKIRGVGMPQL